MFGNSVPKTDVDWAIYRAKGIPGPGQYNLSANRNVVFKFGNHNPPSELEQLINKAKKVPGPTDYFPTTSYKDEMQMKRQAKNAVARKALLPNISDGAAVS